MALKDLFQSLEEGTFEIAQVKQIFNAIDEDRLLQQIKQDFEYLITFEGFGNNLSMSLVLKELETWEPAQLAEQLDFLMDCFRANMTIPSSDFITSSDLAQNLVLKIPAKNLAGKVGCFDKYLELDHDDNKEIWNLAQKMKEFVKLFKDSDLSFQKYQEILTLINK